MDTSGLQSHNREREMESDVFVEGCRGGDGEGPDALPAARLSWHWRFDACGGAGRPHVGGISCGGDWSAVVGGHD